ncbi:uncharacterized protein LOC142608931 [Castanea sativa]|uniref:uncharacterized protein LOC142608931 n=1 Tax=Castanea sativa TaxID=21020 RepID=UPI003F652430
MDTMSRALRQAARSPFSRDIESAPMPSRFTRLPFNSYTGKTNPVEHLVDALLSMKMGAGETLPNYASRYWELYNEIGGGNEKIAASTFRMGLPEEFGLRESLTLKPPEDMRQLMRRIEEYKRLEDDWLQSKGKEPIISYPRNNGFNPRHRKDLRIQELGPAVGGVNVTFKELLVKAGHLKEFLVETGNQETGQADRLRRNPLPPPLGVIEVIHAASRAIKAPTTKGVLTVVSAKGSASEQPPGKKPRYSRQSTAFDDDDLEGTTQPHHDALIVTARIRGFVVKRIMIDQGSGTNVMYPDLYRGLGLKKGDLSKYDTPLMGFDRHMVILEGQISLPVIMGGREVMVTFIVVASFSPYTAIFGRPWIHDMEAVLSTLHIKVKFRTDEGITVIRGDQQVAKQCLVAMAIKQTEQKESAEKAPL